MINNRKANKKKYLGIFLLVVCVLALTFVVTTPFDTASAESPSTAWTKAGISSNASGNDNSLFSDLTKVVYFVMAVGGIWVVTCLVIGGMLLAGSNGNPQRRSAGMISLVTSAAGGFVIYKAYDIASWVATLGAS